VSSRYQTDAPAHHLSLSTEVLESALLTLDQISTRLTVLALSALSNSLQSVRARMLLGDLLADIQDCEKQFGSYTIH
jgi:hypothetical protein